MLFGSKRSSAPRSDAASAALAFSSRSRRSRGKSTRCSQSTAIVAPCEAMGIGLLLPVPIGCSRTVNMAPTGRQVLPDSTATTSYSFGVVSDDVPVLIVGGSLVGLSAAVFLGARGVPSLVVERHVGTAIHPRAALVNQRTIETYRAVGIEQAIEEAAAREFVQNGAIVSVESLGGKELDWYFREINEGVEDLSPSARIFITQIGLEPIL